MLHAEGADCSTKPLTVPVVGEWVDAISHTVTLDDAETNISLSIYIYIYYIYIYIGHRCGHFEDAPQVARPPSARPREGAGA